MKTPGSTKRSLATAGAAVLIGGAAWVWWSIPHSAIGPDRAPTAIPATTQVGTNPPSSGAPSDAGRVAAILAELDSGKDAPTGQDFKVGPNGSLISAPTRRVMLLDELTRRDAKAAAAYAEKILRSFNSSDEWALALRAYALANPTPEGRAFLAAKFREMVGHEAWRKDPSTGFLEAFDVAVHLGGTNLMPTLTELVRQPDNRAVSHAAYLALDRLTISDPVSTLNNLLGQPDALNGREVTRANLFARADVSNPQQKAILENYLLSLAPGPAELEAFAGLYPNANYMISDNLLTRVATPDRDWQVQHDREALKLIESWQADPRFDKLRPQLQEIKSRLSRFVQQAQTVP